MDTETDSNNNINFPKCVVKLKALEVTDIIHDDLANEKFQIKMYEGNQKLLIFKYSVIWLTGDVAFRRINLETQVVDSFFTAFEDSKLNNSSKQTKVLVVILEDQIRVYDKLTSVLVVSFPIHIKNAFPFHKGLIIGKKLDILSVPDQFFTSGIKTSNGLNITSPYVKHTSASIGSGNTIFSAGITNSSAGSFVDSNFLTLTDSVGELGIIASSSTTSFSQTEQLLTYPETTSSCLATTFNHSDKNINVYSIRYLSRSKSSKSKALLNNHVQSRKNSKRTISSSSAMMNISISRIHDDDSKQLRSTSNPLSFDRMASGTEYLPDTTTGYYPASTTESWVLRKDVIFTKLHSIPVKSDIIHLKVFNVSFHDKETLVVVNKQRHMIDVYNFEKLQNKSTSSKLKNHLTFEGLDAHKFDMEGRKCGYILILKKNNQILLYNPFYDLFSPPMIVHPPANEQMIEIDGCQNYEVSFLSENGEHYLTHLSMNIKDKYVEKYIKSLEYLSHNLIHEMFWLRWCSNKQINIPHCTDWKLYVVTLLSMCLPEKINLSSVNTNLNEITGLIKYVEIARINNKTILLNDHRDFSLEPLLPKIVLALHVIREDLKLNILSKSHYDQLSRLLSQLVYWMSWSPGWKQYYDINENLVDKNLQLALPEYINKPPNIIESISSLFSEDLVSYITFSIISGEDESVDKIITTRTYNILRLFEVIVSNEFEDMDLVRTMASFNIDTAELETYPSGIYFVFKNTIELCQRKVKLNWNITNEECKLIGRKDILQLDYDSPRSLTIADNKKARSTLKSTKEIIFELFNDEYNDNHSNTSWDDNLEFDKFNVTKLIFAKDRRFYELIKLLQTSKPQIITYESSATRDDHERLLHQRSIGVKIALRTLTAPIGRGAVFNSSKKPLVTEGFPIPKMNFTSLILPDNLNVTLEDNAIPSYLMECGYFYNGVSAGLLVSKDFKEISGSWVVFNKPTKLNSEHAGFLLGLGLNGHLKQLEEWHIYNYLGPKHIFTSIGLLIGMSASLRGSMDIKMTKVLSVHVVAFLPPGSTDLNVQLPVQTAGIIGIGLIYLESQHRRMSEILLTQICCSLVINDKKVVSEGYQLAAGIALGYINLGKGDNMMSSNDSHIIDELISYGTFIRKEFDKSCSGAIISLMFMFLKSNNHEIAKKIEIPQSNQLLDYVRPDLLMLRVLCKNMIMWDEIVPTKEFIESQIPECVRIRSNIEDMNELNIDNLQYLNILCGLILSISICFASSGNIEAKKILLEYFDKLLGLSMMKPVNYDNKVTLSTIRSIRDLIILGLSIIMAGSGDLDIMRRLRFLQGLSDKYTKYGNYMVVNMSLGFLFLGGGQQAFNNIDLFSIASLITSIYPRFNSEIEEDNYLQGAIRNFWTMGVENRCLTVKKVEDGKEKSKVTNIEVEIFLKNDEMLKVISPCLLPDLRLIKKICVRNEFFYEVEFDLVRSNREANERFSRDLTIYVERRKDYKTLNMGMREMIEMNLKNEEDREEEGYGGVESDEGINRLKNLAIFRNFEDNEKRMLFEEGCEEMSVFEFKQEIEKKKMGDDLKLIFNYVDGVIISKGRKRRVKNSNGEEIEIEMEDEIERGVWNRYNHRFKTHCYNNNHDMESGLSYLSIEFIEKLKREVFKSKAE